MIKFVTLSLCAIIGTVSTPLVSKKPIDTAKVRWVRGLLDAQFEFPTFLPDPDSNLKAMEFSVTESKWQRVYAAPVNEARIFRPDETICFRIVGQGYLAPREPMPMQNWEGSQFKFVKIRKLERRPSAECASRMNTKDR